jgi:outer membrane protein assembly factor BamB
VADRVREDDRDRRRPGEEEVTPTTSRAALVITLLLAGPAAAQPVAAEQVVSRHDPRLDLARARLAVGPDGAVYLASGGRPDGYVLRVSADGTHAGGPVGYATQAVAAAADGTIATAEGHFSHRVAFRAADFAPRGHVPDFLNSDAAGWNAPADVAAGAGGAFYAIDQHRNRVLKVAPPDRVLAAIPLDRLGPPKKNATAGLRVDGPRKRLVLARSDGVVSCVGFDGTPLWELKLKAVGDPPATFDLDPAGNLYLLTAGPEAVRVFDPDGKPAGVVKLTPPAGARPYAITGLRVRGTEFVVKRADPAALFEVYDHTTGNFVRKVAADVEVLTARTPSPVWTAGRPAPFEIAFDPGPRPIRPQFRVFWRPLGTPDFDLLEHANGAVAVPKDAGGLYHVRVTPDVGGRAAEYTVDTVVEVRAPDAVGTVSVFTPLNRYYYARGEAITGTVVVKSKAAPPAKITVRLIRPDFLPRDQVVTLTAGRGEFTIPAELTNELGGPYVFTADLPGHTVAPLHVRIGPGFFGRPTFHLTQYGDYQLGFPQAKFFEQPEAVADHLARSRGLGLNLFADRLGHPTSGLGDLLATATDPALARLTADPLGVAPEKATFEGPVRRTVAGYGAAGIEEHGILLYMDAGLPLGTMYDRRTPGQMEADLTRATEALKPYAAFRGWSWAANWWCEKEGANAAKDDTEKAAYTAALKRAKETGRWDPVLDAVADRTFALKPDAAARFKAVMEKVAPGKVGAATGSYRAILTHPPAVFRTADEVDLQYQAEQIWAPQAGPHQVDFYKRPGKRAWAHPEVWNDDGTGATVLPNLFQTLMRGADGVGKSGPVQAGFTADTRDRADPRCGGPGVTSVFRAAFDVLGRYGAWNAALTNADRVAIVVSTRMQKIEAWDGKLGSAYFDGLFEAYNACLYAHRPASFVFVEDLAPETLKRYKAVLVVGQRVELDPPLAAALKDAAAAGVKVFHDATCRPEVVKGFTPLGVAFDRVRQDPKVPQDDAAHWRLPGYFVAQAAALKKVLGPVVPPVAECDNPEVMLTERRAGEARYIWAVNNTTPGWDPGLAWRVGLLCAQRVPVVAKLKLDVPHGWRVVDVLAGAEVKHDNGVVVADLRTAPARLYAILPPLAASRGPQPATPQAAPVSFGPHVRDIALSPDGQTALLNCYNWDHNLYAIDPATGATRWRGKVGHGFAFDPTPAAGGFAVQGFDLHTAEGYHLYRLGADGTPARRFALFGLPRRATGWAVGADLLDAGLNAFAADPAGGWVAAAGDLGLVAWDADGRELWADEWWKTGRKRVRLVALDEGTLVVLDGGTATARDARTGRERWAVKLPDAGTLRGGIVSADRGTLAVVSDALGGRVFVLRGGRLVNTLLTPASEVAVAADGSRVVVTDGRQLKAFDPLGGLLWTVTGDDLLRHPRLSPDGSRVVVGSELGTLTVLDRDGGTVATRDLRALPAAEWLPGGDLLVATWLGTVARFDPTLKVKWETHLTPTETDARAKLLAADTTPTARKTGWGNAAAVPLLLTPNLLAPGKQLITARFDPQSPGSVEWQNPVELLTDGKPDAPPRPWLRWTDVGFIDSGWHDKMTFQIDTFRTQWRVTGVTFVEDPTHPESWLRDVKLQWWDAAAAAWRDGPTMLSDAAVHSHVFDHPVEAAKFRLVAPPGGTWPVGNVRLGELVFHGEELGPSHPDAVARRPLAVLFDEREADLECLRYPGRPFRFAYTGAYSGGKCLELTAAGRTDPLWTPPFGHAVPNWDFTIAENPGPGQYRYLQFAWKATSEQTTGIGLLLGWVGVTVGDADWEHWASAKVTVPGKPPAGWTTVRVDLWAAMKGKPERVRTLSLMAVGGGAAFDQIVLGRTEADLPPGK